MAGGDPQTRKSVDGRRNCCHATRDRSEQGCVVVWGWEESVFMHGERAPALIFVSVIVHHQECVRMLCRASGNAALLKN